MPSFLLEFAPYAGVFGARKSTFNFLDRLFKVKFLLCTGNKYPPFFIFVKAIKKAGISKTYQHLTILLGGDIYPLI